MTPTDHNWSRTFKIVSTLQGKTQQTYKKET